MRGSFSWRSWRGTKNFSGSWFTHAQSTTAVLVPPCSCPPRGPQLELGEVQSTTQERAIQVHTQNMLSKCTLITCYPSAHPRTYYPSAHPITCYPSAHSERAIQVRTQNVLSKCTPKNVLSKCTLRTCYPSARYHSYHSPAPLSCTTHKLPQLSWHFPLPGRRNFYSCTIVHQSAISCNKT